MKKILISGGNSKFAKELLNVNDKFEILALPRNKMDVTDLHSISNAISIHKPDYFIHTAALSRPMILHKESTKLIYISTDFVYEGTIGNYKETDPVLPVNGYAWSKLGGECSVKLYENSLIIRTAMVEYPYPHEKAFVDVRKSLIEYKEAARLTLELLDQSGTINLGGESDTIYNHVKSIKEDIGKISRNDITDLDIAIDSSMDTNKLKRILNDKSI